MTREQTKEAIRVMQAYVDRKKIQFNVQSKWGSMEWNNTDEPDWNWDAHYYRIKPTATLRPWTADEVPVGGQIRSKVNTVYRMLIDRTANHGVREDWLKSYEHSTDGGKTWLPCGVVEEAQ